jgi:hypothetical protein
MSKTVDILQRQRQRQLQLGADKMFQLQRHAADTNVPAGSAVDVLLLTSGANNKLLTLSFFSLIECLNACLGSGGCHPNGV